MREFRIYAEIGENPDTVSFREFIREVEKEINSDEEILERAKRCNQEFFAEMQKIVENPENALYAGTMIKGIKDRITRWSYIKGLEYDGEAYEAEIDELDRKFYIRKVEA